MFFKRIYLLACSLLIVGLLSGCAADIKSGPTTTDPQGTAAQGQKQEEINVTVYYPTKDALYLVPTDVKMIKDEKWLEKGLDLLSQNPKDANLAPAFPAQNMIKSIRIEGDNAYVDMNGESLQKASRGSTLEQIIIQSIVYTVTKNTKVKQVAFTIDGENKSTLLGHIDIVDPVQPDPNWIKK